MLNNPSIPQCEISWSKTRTFTRGIRRGACAMLPVLPLNAGHSRRHPTGRVPGYIAIRTPQRGNHGQTQCLHPNACGIQQPTQHVSTEDKRGHPYAPGGEWCAPLHPCNPYPLRRNESLRVILSCLTCSPHSVTLARSAIPIPVRVRARVLFGVLMAVDACRMLGTITSASHVLIPI